MNSDFKLVGGLLLGPNSEKDIRFPAFLLPVFKKDNNYYTQSLKRAKHPYTYFEDCSFERISKDLFVDNDNKSILITIDNIDPNIDFSKKLYLFALSEYSIISGNLIEFTEKLNSLKSNSQTTLNAKEIYTKRCRQYQKNGFTSQNEEMTAYLEKQETLSL